MTAFCLPHTLPLHHPWPSPLHGDIIIHTSTTTMTATNYALQINSHFVFNIISQEGQV